MQGSEKEGEQTLRPMVSKPQMEKGGSNWFRKEDKQEVIYKVKMGKAKAQEGSSDGLGPLGISNGAQEGKDGNTKHTRPGVLKLVTRPIGDKCTQDSLNHTTLDPTKHVAICVRSDKPGPLLSKVRPRRKEGLIILQWPWGSGWPPDKRQTVNIRRRVKTKSSRKKHHKVLAADEEEMMPAECWTGSEEN